MIKSEHVHRSVRTDDWDVIKDFFYLFKEKKGIKVEKAAYITLCGQTKGISQIMRFPDMKACDEKQDWSMHIQSHSHNWSRIKKINKELYFPDFRTPTDELRAKLMEYDDKIAALYEEKAKYLNECFDTLPLMKLVDLPEIFFDTNKFKSDEIAFEKILKHYKED